MARRITIFVIVILVVGATTVFAQNTEFRRVELSYGISLDIPSNWTVLSQDTRKEIRAVGEAMVNDAGIEVAGGRKETLLAVNATPDPTGAMIRISVVSPPDYTQEDIAAATSTDLQETGIEVMNAYKKLEASGGLKLLEMQTVRIEKISNHLALVIPYIRASAKGPSPWQVTQYKIPTSNCLVEVTLSYRQSDSIVWSPTLEKVKYSIVIQGEAKKETLAKGSSVMKHLYGSFWWLTIIVSFVLTWGIGLIPPLIVRHWIIRRPLTKPWAIGLVILFWMVNIFIFTALGSQSKTHAALFFVAWVSYIILKKDRK